MTESQNAATPVTLHLFLGIGLVTVSLAFFVLRYLGFQLMHDTVPPTVAYVLSGLSVVLAALALVIFKPRVPDRSPGQSVDEYWSTPEVVTRIMTVWFLLEGAGTMAAAGYFFTGEPVSAIATGAAIVAFWLCGPNVFAKA